MTLIIQWFHRCKQFFSQWKVFTLVDFNKTFMMQWAKASRQAFYMLGTFILLNLLGLSDWIVELSYWFFPTHETQALMGLVKNYEVNTAREPFVLFAWLVCWLILIIAVVNALKCSLILLLDSKPNDINDVQSTNDSVGITDKTVVMTPAVQASHKKQEAEKRVVQQNAQMNNRYMITSELGKGAMGVVYLAKDTVLHREVALKSLSAQLASQQAFSERFYREARMVAKLNHPNIVQIHDFTEQDGKFMIAMELVKGSPLDELIQVEKLAKKKVYDIATQIANAMSYAHKRGVIHRDLKPANVLITDEGQVKLTDFGLAKINGTNETQVGTIMGSPLYMSPEQAKGDLVDHRADIYSFGIMFYQLLTGKVPFMGETALEVVAQHLTKPLPLDSTICVDLSEGDRALLQLLTQKLPEQRAQSFEEVFSSIKDLNGIGINI